MGFATPWALAGLLALPLLLLVYLLRRRGRELAVPALFLWAAVAAPAAGPRVAPRRLPLVFWLELLALALLVTGAAGPWLLAPGTRPLLVVLDPSYSMGAGGARSPRDEAEAALLVALADEPRLRTTLVLAGDPPTILGEDLSRSAVAAALRRWRPEVATARIDAVLRLAAERAPSRGGDADAAGVAASPPAVLVLTDGPPPPDLPPSVAWWAFGAPLPNLALVAAGRTAGLARETAEGAPAGADAARPDRVTLEVANLGAQPASVALTVGVGEREATSRRTLGAGEGWRLRLEVPAGVSVQARLPGDALPLDDLVALPALAASPVSVAIGGLPPALLRSVRSAIGASGIARLDGPPEGATLEVLLAPAAAPPVPGRWRLVVHREEAATAYLGPFAVDARHPLAPGLAAEGVVWAAGGAPGNSRGRPVIAAGPVVLVSDEERSDGGHDLHLRLREDLSTLERTPIWPVLWWNLLAWRCAELPGPAEPVQRLGEVAALRLPPGVERARVRGGGWEGEVEAGAAASEGNEGAPAVVRWLPPRPGEYRIEAGAARFAMGVATLQREESDLRGRVSVRRGSLAGIAPPPGRRPAAWLVGMVALALLALEAALLASAGGRGRGVVATPASGPLEGASG